MKKTNDEVDLIDSKPYREIIDSLTYIMAATRPDICYTVTTLYQVLAKPFNEGKARLTLFKRQNQSVTKI